MIPSSSPYSRTPIRDTFSGDVRGLIKGSYKARQIEQTREVFCKSFEPLSDELKKKHNFYAKCGVAET